MSDAPVLVLDTHVWIWLAAGQGKLLNSTVTALERASVGGGILVPAICVWELALLESKGKISLDKPANIWVDEALSGPGISLAPLTPEVCIDSCSLPGRFHGDPADRIIVATARMARAKLVTRDKRILQYAKNGYLDTIPA